MVANKQSHLELKCWELRPGKGAPREQKCITCRSKLELKPVIARCVAERDPKTGHWVEHVHPWYCMDCVAAQIGKEWR